MEELPAGLIGAVSLKLAAIGVESDRPLFEPATTVNTGSAPGERTVADPEWI